MKIKDIEVTTETKLATLMKGHLSLEPDKNLKIEKEKWYVVSDGCIAKIIAQCHGDKTFLAYVQRPYGGTIFVVFEGGKLTNKLYIVREAPDNPGKDKLVKTIYNSPDYNKKIREHWERSFMLDWARCVYIKPGCLQTPERAFNHDR